MKLSGPETQSNREDSIGSVLKELSIPDSVGG